MIVAFDLDDTLYNEIDYVLSGFAEVAKWISGLSLKDHRIIFDFMVSELKINGRGKIFDNTLNYFYKKNKKNIRKCITIYRLHNPQIKLEERIIKILQELSIQNQLYIVTDGNKIVQNNKIKALKLEQYVKKAFITYRYGLKSSKPSLNCFEMIKNLEKTSWNNMVYVGDNPNKDFVNLNKVGAITIRILKGDYANIIVSNEFDAKYKINNLNELSTILNKIS